MMHPICVPVVAEPIDPGQIWNQYADIPSEPPALMDGQISGVVEFRERVPLTAGAANAHGQIVFVPPSMTSFRNVITLGMYNATVYANGSVLNPSCWELDKKRGQITVSRYTVGVNITPWPPELTVSYYNYVGAVGGGAVGGAGTITTGRGLTSTSTQSGQTLELSLPSNTVLVTDAAGALVPTPAAPDDLAILAGASALTGILVGGNGRMRASELSETKAAALERLAPLSVCITDADGVLQSADDSPGYLYNDGRGNITWHGTNIPFEYLGVLSDEQEMLSHTEVATGAYYIIGTNMQYRDTYLYAMDVLIASRAGWTAISRQMNAVCSQEPRYISCVMNAGYNKCGGKDHEMLVDSPQPGAITVKQLIAGTGITLAATPIGVSISAIQAKPCGANMPTSKMSVGVYATCNDRTLMFKSLVAGNGIVLLDSSNTITFAATNEGTLINIASSGGGTMQMDMTGPPVDLIVGKHATREAIVKTLTATGSVKVIDNGSYINIHGAAGEITLASNMLADAPGMYSHKHGNMLCFRNLLAGPGMMVRTQHDALVVNNAGVIDIISSACGDESIISSGNAGYPFARRLTAGQNISLSGDGNQIIVTAHTTGEIVSCVNIGAGCGGIGLFAQKIGSELQFKMLLAGRGIDLVDGDQAIRITNSGVMQVCDSSAQGVSMLTGSAIVPVIKRLLAGPNIIIADLDDAVIISVRVSGGLHLPDETGVEVTDRMLYYSKESLYAPAVRTQHLHTGQMRIGNTMLESSGCVLAVRAVDSRTPQMSVDSAGVLACAGLELAGYRINVSGGQLQCRPAGYVEHAGWTPDTLVSKRAYNHPVRAGQNLVASIEFIGDACVTCNVQIIVCTLDTTIHHELFTATSTGGLVTHKNIFGMDGDAFSIMIIDSTLKIYCECSGPGVIVCEMMFVVPLESMLANVVITT